MLQFFFVCLLVWVSILPLKLNRYIFVNGTFNLNYVHIIIFTLCIIQKHYSEEKNMLQDELQLQAFTTQRQDPFSIVKYINQSIHIHSNAFISFIKNCTFNLACLFRCTNCNKKTSHIYFWHCTFNFKTCIIALNKIMYQSKTLTSGLCFICCDAGSMEARSGSLSRQEFILVKVLLSLWFRCIHNPLYALLFIFEQL